MKFCLLFSFALVAMLCAIPYASAEIIAQYRMEVASPQTVSQVTGGDLTAGGGLTLFNVNSTLTWTDVDLPQLSVTSTASTTFAEAVINESWFTFDLTVDGGVSGLDLNSLTFDSARGGSATERGYGVLASVNGGSDVTVQGGTLVVAQRPDNTPQNVDLSGTGILQGLGAGDVVQFKIAMYAPTSGSSIVFDNITVNTAEIPEPTTASLMGLGALALVSIRRRRK